MRRHSQGKSVTDTALPLLLRVSCMSLRGAQRRGNLIRAYNETRPVGREHVHAVREAADSRKKRVCTQSLVPTRCRDISLPHSKAIFLRFIWLAF